MQKNLFRHLSDTSINKSGWLLIAVGSLTWLLTMVKSGIIYSFGMGFWGPNGHDGVWHVALAKSLAKGSWEIPVFAGERIQNYHIGFDLILAWLSKLTFIPIHNLYFQIIPPIFAVGIGIFAYKFVLLWRRSKREAFWATFFVYFGGGFGWIVTILRNGTINGESLFWSQQAISTLVNPPFALSLLIMYVGLYYLIKGLRQKNKKSLTIATFLFGILVQVKVYAGLLILLGLFTAGFWHILKRKGVSLIKVATGALMISILVFSPITLSAEKTVIFKPFWFLETMMGFQDRFYWPKFAEAMVNYKLAGNFIKGIPAYTIALLIFIIGNLGTRILSVGWFIKKRNPFNNYQYIDVLVVTTIVAGFAISLLYIQAGTPWNTIQFMYYSLIFTGILAGITIGSLIEMIRTRTVLVRVVIFLTVLLTIPTTIGTLWNHYLPSRPPSKISNDELEALEFLKIQPEGVVLTQPFDRDLAEGSVQNPPRPLYFYESTAYVSAFSGKTVYLEDEVNLEIAGYPWDQRRLNVKHFFSKINPEFLNNENISYLYLVKPLDVNTSGLEFLSRIFSNNEVDIYKANPASGW